MKEKIVERNKRDMGESRSGGKLKRSTLKERRTGMKKGRRGIKLEERRAEEREVTGKTDERKSVVRRCLKEGLSAGPAVVLLVGQRPGFSSERKVNSSLIGVVYIPPAAA